VASADRNENPPSRNPSLAVRAGRSGLAWVVFGLVAVLAAGSDLWSKEVAFSALLAEPGLSERFARQADRMEDIQDPAIPPAESQAFSRLVLDRVQPTRRVCFGLSLTLRTNPGVVFGFDALPRLLVACVTVVMIVVIVIVFVTSGRGVRWLHVALGLILGGAVGNLYDRLFGEVRLEGLPSIRYHVRDFIDCSELHYPYVFNVADIWLVVGVGMVALYWLIDARQQKRIARDQERGGPV
jgi:signal peptidase II